MASNVYTKNEILQNLASRGYFIDAYTLDTFFEKWKVEAIFEDEQGSEFFDKNALDLVLNNLFNTKDEEKEEEKAPSEPKESKEQVKTTTPEPKQETEKLNILDEELKIEDTETSQLLNNISLSDGTPLIDKVNDLEGIEINPESVLKENTTIQQFETPTLNNDQTPQPEKKLGILEGAMQATGQEFIPNIPTNAPASEIIPPADETSDFDDISLLSESLEAQEKFREYVMSELSKKNVDLTPKSNEFKLDISERTLSMIARTMAKKIAKHVNSICSQDAKSASQLAQVEEQNKKLEQRTRDLEEQNKKLRLLLAESNKNLNSYKPSIFGLYKKVNPNK